MLRAEAVTEREVGVDELPPGIGFGQLLTQAPYVDIHRAVARAERAAPGVFGQFLPADDCAGVAGKGNQQPELMTRQVQRVAIHNGHVLTGTDLERSFAEYLGQRGFHKWERAICACRGSYPPVNHL